MNPLARNVLLALCVPAALVVAGYLNAWAALDACADDAYRKDRGRSGFDMRGREVPLQRNAISAHIEGPFRVQARYWLPADLHGSWHSRTYLVFGGYRRLLDSQDIHLVRADPADASALAASGPGRPRAPTPRASTERG